MRSIKLRIGVSSVQNVLACFCLLYLYGGLFDYIPAFTRGMAYCAYLVWLFLAVASNRSFINQLFNNGWPIYLLLFINYIVSLFAPNSHIVSNNTVFLYICVIHSISFYYLNDRKINGRRLILFVLLVNFAFILARSFSALLTNPMVSRYLGAGLERYGQIVDLQNMVGETNNLSVDQVKGIGSYGFFNGIAFSQIPILFYAQKQKKFEYKLIAYALLLFSIIVSIQASFVTSMMLSIFLIIFLVIASKQRKINSSVLLLLILVICCLLTFTGLIPALLQLAANRIGNVTISARLNELAQAFSGNLEGATDFSSRMNLYSTSLMSFISNPFFGTMGKTNVSGLIGGHATGFDVLGLYGFIGLLYWKFWKKQYMRIKGSLPYHTVPYINAAALFFVGLLLLNSVTSVQIFIGAMLFLPFGLKYVHEKHGEVAS